MKKYPQINSFAVGILAGVLLTYAASAGAWTGPSSTPTGGNVDAPVNVGSVTQSKSGTLSTQGFADFGTSFFQGIADFFSATGSGSFHISYSDPSSSVGGAWIRNDGAAAVFSTWTTGGLYLGYGGDTNKTIRIGNGSLGVLEVKGNAPFQSLVVDGSGKVGIGTSSPVQKLDVNGIIKSSGSTNSLMFADRSTSGHTWEWYSTGDTAGLYKNFSTSGTVMTVDGSNGRVGIGTASPSTNLEVNGAIKSTNLQVTNLGGLGSTVVGVDNSGNFEPLTSSAGLYLITRTDCNTVGTPTASYPKGNLGYQSVTTYSTCWAGPGGTTAYPNTYLGALY